MFCLFHFMCVLKITLYHGYLSHPLYFILYALYSIMWIYHSLLNLFSMYKHVHFFQHFTFIIKSAMTTLYVCILFLKIYLLGKFLDIEFLWHNVSTHVVLLNMTKISSIILSSNCIPKSNTRVLEWLFCHIFTKRECRTLYFLLI